MTERVCTDYILRGCIYLNNSNFDVLSGIRILRKDSKGTATVQFFDGPHDPLTFLDSVKVLDAKMSIIEGRMLFGLGLSQELSEWRE
jgi:hypothetical protein